MGLRAFFIGVGDEQAYFAYLVSLSSRNLPNSHLHCLVSRTKKVRQRKMKFAKIVSKPPEENYSASEVARVVKHSHLHRAYLISFDVKYI